MSNEAINLKFVLFVLRAHTGASYEGPTRAVQGPSGVARITGIKAPRTKLHSAPPNADAQGVMPHTCAQTNPSNWLCVAKHLGVAAAHGLEDMRLWRASGANLCALRAPLAQDPAVRHPKKAVPSGRKQV